jgi:glycosyltransferase involved in cell wall biosynthesis
MAASLHAQAVARFAGSSPDANGGKIMPVPPAFPRSIGIVMHDFPLGGTERIALRLAKAWLALGRRVTIFVGHDAGPLRAIVPGGAELRVAEPAIPRSRGSRERLGQAAARFFSAEPVDALFVTGNYHWEVVPSLTTVPGRPIILAQISSPLAMPQRRWLRQWFFRQRMRRLLKKADALVAMSESYRRDADRMMGKPIARSIPLPALDDETALLTPASGHIILAAGRLIEQKGFDLLIDAFIALDDPKARLVIVGSGPEESALRKRAASSPAADRIVLTGYAPDIRPFLSEARLFVLPSRFEGYGAVIVEALGAGRPVIATACTPAVDDVLADPANGIVVPVEDVPALTAALRNLLDRPAPDPQQLADAVASFRIDRGASAYLELFAEAKSRR